MGSCFCSCFMAEHFGGRAAFIMPAGWSPYTRPLPAGPWPLRRFSGSRGISQLVRAVPAIAAFPNFTAGEIVINQLAVLKFQAFQAGDIALFCGFHHPGAAAVFCGRRRRCKRGRNRSCGGGRRFWLGLPGRGADITGGCAGESGAARAAGRRCIAACGQQQCTQGCSGQAKRKLFHSGCLTF